MGHSGGRYGRRWAERGTTRIAVRPRTRRPGSRRSPRLLLQVLLGLVALVGAQAIADPSAPSWDAVSRPSVAQAEPGSPGGVTTVDVAAGVRVASSPPGPTVADELAAVGPLHAAPLETIQSTSSAVLAPAAPPPAPAGVWVGTAGRDAYLRAAPNRGQPPVGELEAGQPVQVVRWVSGEEVEKENPVWAELSTGHFVFSAALRRAPLAGPPSLPAEAPTQGRWVDVNLLEQVATAYEGRTPIKSVLISSGRPGWTTPKGTFRVQRRVAKETMDARTLGAGVLATYLVENVRFTQYFHPDGSAIHENYWRRPALFGMPGSHGCVGMLPADAAWFWEFATLGTPVFVHE